MAFADATNPRTIWNGWGGTPVVLKAGVSVKQGDPIGYSDGWCLADANAGIPAKYVAGDTMTGDGYKELTVYRGAVVRGFSGGTVGNPLYLSDTAGGYSDSASATSEQKVGRMLSATAALVEPDAFDDKFTISHNLTIASNACADIFFLATQRVKVTKISWVHGTAASAATVTVERLQGTEAVTAGDDLLGATKIDANAAANTVQTPALTGTAAHLVLEPGNRLAIKKATGDNLASLANACISVEFERA